MSRVACRCSSEISMSNFRWRCSVLSQHFFGLTRLKPIRKTYLHSTSFDPAFLTYLKQKIQVTGPMTVATYMKEALTNPKWGYYMHRDVFGKAGDFITSPDLSQMFGEIIGIWFYNQWLNNGKPSNVNIVELGPGRGTLMSDILWVLGKFTNVSDIFSVHLVEVSPEMKRIQRKHLQISIKDDSVRARTPTNVRVTWYDRIHEIPKGYTFLIAHEFFDALPVHQFQKTPNGWREILVDCNTENSELRFVLAPGPSYIAETFISKQHESAYCEVCPEAAVVMDYTSTLIQKFGGAALMIDYGEQGSNRLSLRGFKNHKLQDDVLKKPGTMDITANVDFDLLRKATKNRVRTFGPIAQGNFLENMGMLTRLRILKTKAGLIQKTGLDNAYNYLVSPEHMGEKFKVFAAINKTETVPAGFEPPQF